MPSVRQDPTDTIRLLGNGNEAMISGALVGALEISDPTRRGGGPFLVGAGYPITPVNEVVEWGNRHFAAVGAEFIQAESEIAAANMVLGAAALGVPAFTATSSPGMSLMLEAISYAAAMELGGLVFANVARGGPGLGNVQGAQSDLLQALGGGHGDCRLLVFAPSSAQEMFDLTRRAFALSARHRIPALILADGHVGQMQEGFTVACERAGIRASEQAAPTGVRTSIFVREGAMAAHNWRLARRFEEARQDEFFREESVALHTQPLAPAPATELRGDKTSARTELRGDKTSARGEGEGSDAAEILVVAHGIFARCARGVVDRARRQGLSVGLMTLRVLSPFPGEALRAAARRCRALFVLEGSQGQLHSVVRRECGESVLIGLGAFPGGVLPEEQQICDALADLKSRLTPAYDQAREAALRAGDMIEGISRHLGDPGRAAHDTLAPGATAHDLDLEQRARGRRPPAAVMTDVCPSHCPGCGEPAVIAALGRVLDEVADLRPVIYSPVGCAVFTGDLFDTARIDVIQVPHGRGPAAAAASKRARPSSPVIVIQGDGDALSIGANELLHAIERGDPITLLVLNNGLFGMTGGQVSATTPPGPTRVGQPLDLFTLTDHPGVSYFRRLIADDQSGVAGLERALRSALAHQMSGTGLSIVEVLTACPTYQGEDGRGAARRYVREVLARQFPPDRRRGEDIETPLGAIVADSRRHARATPRTESSLPAFLRSMLEAPAVSAPLDRELTVFLCGRGGQGIQTVARVLLRAFAAACPGATLLPWYGPEVRRGITTASLRLTACPGLNPQLQRGEVDLFICLDPWGFEEKAHLIRTPGGVVAYDSGLCGEPPGGDGWTLLGLPASEISQRSLGTRRCANMILAARAQSELGLPRRSEVEGSIRALCRDPEMNLRAWNLGLLAREEAGSQRPD
jgi:2-oxoglutarate ferredoxin oxidoreductase subunit alpha